MTSSFRRTIVVLTVVSLLSAVAAAGYALSRPVRFQTSISFAVNRIHQNAGTNYEYDGYYAIQAADLFSQTVVSWFSTPSVILEVYDRAGLANTVTSLGALNSRFKTKKYAAQNIVVTFSEGSRERAEKVAQAVTETMQTRAAKLNQTADAKALFEIVGSKSVIVESKPSPLTFGFAGLLAGFLASLSVFSLAAYLRSLTAPGGYADRH